MGRQIILKPDGKFAIWSSVVDDFILDDASEIDVVATIVEHAAYNAAKQTTTRIRELRDGNHQETQYTLTYKEACETRDEVHGTRDSAD